MSYGRILSAGIEVDGDELQSDHSATDTILDVDNALSFYEPDFGETIQVRIVAEDETEELATIKVPETEDEDTVDDEEGFVHLAAGLVNAYPAGSRVEVYPRTQRLVAQVRLDDAEEDEETIDAVVHHSLYDKIPEGVDLDFAVEMDYDGETFYVTNILGEEPSVDGGFLSPGTIAYPALAVGAIRIVDTEADLANLDAKPGDAAYVRGKAGLYKYMDQPPFVTTYDENGDPVQTEIDPVAGTTNWYRTTDAADILANSITATHIRTETLDGITLNGLFINGGTITGGTVRTAASGARVEMSDALIDRILWKDDSITYALINYDDVTDDEMRVYSRHNLKLETDSAFDGTIILQSADQTIHLGGSPTTSPCIITGSGSPGGVISAPPGSIYLRTDPVDADDVLWVKHTGTGNTGWARNFAS